MVNIEGARKPFILSVSDSCTWRHNTHRHIWALQACVSGHQSIHHHGCETADKQNASTSQHQMALSWIVFCLLYFGKSAFSLITIQTQLVLCSYFVSCSRRRVMDNNDEIVMPVLLGRRRRSAVRLSGCPGVVEVFMRVCRWVRFPR